MKIVHLTPGTGNFHCGSCLRDNHLVKALRRQGHDVLMAPLYLPLVTDDAAATESAPIFAGGINMFLQQKFALFRKTPRWLDKLLDAPRLLLGAAKRAGMTSARDLGEMTLESLRGTEGRQAKEWRRLLEWIKSTGVPDVVSLSNGLLTGLAPAIRQELGAPVICSLQGEDSFLDTLPPPYQEKSWELFRQNSQHVSRYIGVSQYYADTMASRLALEPGKMTVVRNGMDFSAYSPSPTKPPVPTIGYLARLCQGKGLDQLVSAFILLKQRGHVPSARLKLGGTKTSADEKFINIQKVRLHAAGCDADVSWHPNLSLEDKIQFLQSLTTLSVPATYGEAFGLYVIEALACGVPVVEPDHAGLGELVRATEGGLLCAPNSTEALTDALETILTNPSLAQELGDTGCGRVRDNFSSDRMARDFAEVCRQSLFC